MMCIKELDEYFSIQSNRESLVSRDRELSLRSMFVEEIRENILFNSINGFSTSAELHLARKLLQPNGFDVYTKKHFI